MHVVFRHDMDVVSKNPGGGVDPRHAVPWARRQGVLSFGYLFFARAKKSSSLPDRGAKAFAPASFHCLAFPFPRNLIPPREGGNSQGMKAKLSLLLRRSELL